MKSFFRTILAILVTDVLIICGVAMVLLLKAKEVPRPSKGTVLVQPIEGAVPEFTPPSLGLPIGTTPLSQTVLLENLEKARHDKRIRAVVLKVAEPGMGWAKCDELREAIASLRSAGKPVYAYAEFLTPRGLYLGSACDSLFLLRNGYVSLHGFRAGRPFVKGALEKLGIKDNLHKIEKYKSAAEIVQRKEFSADARRNIDWILDEIYPSFLATVEESRHMAPGSFESLALAPGALSPAEAVGARLADRLVYWDQVEATLMKIPGVEARKDTGKKGKGKTLGPRPRTIDGALYSKIPREKAGIRAKKTVAVIHAQGFIGGEKSGSGILGATMGAGTMEQAFRQATENKDVAAIVFRIDSGGGESSTSWRINRAAVRAGGVKPVVVSMCDLAGSGAYLISYPCSTLVAGRLSIVGSIGSISGKFNLRGLYDKLGITRDFVTRGPNALMESDYSDYTPEQFEAFTKHHWMDYQEWVDDIARCRGMTPAEVDSVGRGRVWTGRQALERGLVDSLGTLDTAIRIAKMKAGIPKDAEVRLVHYPKPEGLLDSIRGGMAASLTSMIRAFIEPLVHKGTWAVDWNDYGF